MKSNVDAELLSSYHPVTNPRLLSKVDQGIVFEQTNLYLESNSLTSKYQSAFRRLHSTKTASLKVFMTSFVIWTSSVPCFINALDFLGAFDIIDQQFLFEIIAKKIGFQCVVLPFVNNHLSNSSQQVSINERLFGDVKVKTGVSKGSVFG